MIASSIRISSISSGGMLTHAERVNYPEYLKCTCNIKPSPQNILEEYMYCHSLNIINYGSFSKNYLLVLVKCTASFFNYICKIKGAVLRFLPRTLYQKPHTTCNELDISHYMSCRRHTTSS